MKASGKTAARFLGTLVLASALWACNRAGDEPGAPTGPGTEYNPEIDTPHATITVRAKPGEIAPGESFDLMATFLNADGEPVVGVPLGAQAEAGGSGSEYFSFITNATLTNENGKASIGVVSKSNTPSGSYTFVVYSTTPGPLAQGFAGVKVEGSGGETISTPSAPTGPATVTGGVGANFMVAGAVSSAGHPVKYVFSWGDGATSTVVADSSGEGVAAHTYAAPLACPGTATTTYQVTVKAQCALDPSIVSRTSNALNVTVKCP